MNNTDFEKTVNKGRRLLAKEEEVKSRYEHYCGLDTTFNALRDERIEQEEAAEEAGLEGRDLEREIQGAVCNENLAEANMEEAYDEWKKAESELEELKKGV